MGIGRHAQLTLLQQLWSLYSFYSLRLFLYDNIVNLTRKIFQGLLFGLFTSIMFGTQVSAIWNDETGIEALKKEEARWVKKSRWKSMQAVFGRFSLSWFSPFSDITPGGKQYGYLISVWSVLTSQHTHNICNSFSLLFLCDHRGSKL